MYICLHCGHEFEEPHNRYNKRWSDSDDSEPCCPNCGSEDIEEALICEECGAVKSADEIVNGMCADCISIAAEDMRQAYEYGADRTEVIELNGVLAMAFSKVQIEAILTNYLMNNGDFAAECKKFALDDKFDFTDWLAERRKK
jgi:DNA-directed RNA polymerase subunit RPC12/RpoP